MVEVRFLKLTSNAISPRKATSGAAGFDLSAASITKVYNIANGSLRYVEYGTGIAIELPPGYCALAMPRSSISNTSLTLSNSVGLIDTDYRGEITFRFRCDYSTITEYGIGDRIGQLLILPSLDVKMTQAPKLSDTERGSGSYGSTGRGELA